MNIDSGYFYALLRDGDSKPLAYVERDWFGDKWQKVYDFVRGCLTNPVMKKLPQVGTVAGKFEIEFFETEEEIGFYTDLLCKRRARLALEDSIQKVALPMIQNPKDQDHDPSEAARELMMACAEIRRKYRTSYGETMDYNTEVGVRIEEYNKRKAMKGLIGIPYPFQPMNDATGGLIGGELAVFFTASGLGKTWMLCQVVHSAMAAGCDGACFSQEMKPARLALRLDALGAGISPDRHRRGCLTPEEEEKMRDYLRSLPKRPKLHMFGPKDIRTLADFEATLAAIRPNIEYIVWDSPYLVCRADKWEVKTEFVYGLKTLAEDYDIPMFVTWQLNRKGEPALTDAIRTDADHNFQADDEGLREMRQIRVYSTKTRDGLKLENMLLQWDTTEGNFEVLSWKIPGMGDSYQDYTVGYGTDAS